MLNRLKFLATGGGSKPNFVDEYGTTVLASVGMFFGLVVALWIWSGRGGGEILMNTFAVVGTPTVWYLIRRTFSSDRSAKRATEDQEDLERVLFFTVLASAVWTLLFWLTSLSISTP